MPRFELFRAPHKGVNLVESSAGTGKTYNITGLVVRFLAEGIVNHPEEILVVTFTKAATQELKERIRSRIREGADVLSGASDPEGDNFLTELKERFGDKPEAAERLRAALGEMDKSSVFTIHGFCQQALQEFVFESNSPFEVSYSGNDEELSQEAADDIWRGEIRRLKNDGTKSRLLLRYLIKELKSPENFLSLIKTLAGKPYVSFLIENPEIVLENGLIQLQRVIQQLKATFNYEEIRDLLDNEDMNKQSYKIEQVEDMLKDFQQIDNDDAYFDTKKRKFIKLAQDRIKVKKGKVPQHPFFKVVEEFSKVDIAELKEAYCILLNQKYRERYKTLKQERGFRNFDDILEEMQRSVEANQEMRMRLREKYPVALVDEFQDTDPVQLAIFRKLYFESTEKNCIYMIGDPKQSIYKFRGADIFSYQEAAESDGVRTFTLDKNYRSSAGMVESVNEFFTWKNREKDWPAGVRFMESEANRKESEIRIDDGDSAFRPMQFLVPGSQGKMNKGDAQRFVARQIAAEVSRLLKLSRDGKAELTIKEKKLPLKPGHIAVLVKSHKEARQVKNELLKRNIKSVHRSDKSVFDSDEAGFIIHLLQVMLERGNPSRMRTFLFDKLIGFHMSELNEIEEDAGLSTEITSAFAELQSIYEEDGFPAMLRSFLNMNLARIDREPVRVTERILSFPDGERIFTNLMHISELVDEQERLTKPGTDELIQWLHHKKNTGKGTEDTEMRLDSDDDLVQIMTIHSSKGLEFPVVFCASLWALKPDRDQKKSALLFHNERQTCADITVHRESDYAGLVKEEEMGENLRLMYVALTRAAQACFISVPWNLKSDAPLWYILEGSDATEGKGKGKEVADSEIMQRLRDFSQHIPKLAAVRETEETPPDGIETAGSQFGPKVRKLDRPLPSEPGWYLTSYSSVKKAGSKDQAKDQNAFARAETTDDKAPESETEADKPGDSAAYSSILDFPRGARAGTFMHRLFEEIEFTRYKEEGPGVVSRCLQDEGFDAEWAPVLSGMIEKVLTRPLEPAGARLADISPESRRAEMEFYFTMKKAGFQELTDIINGEKVNRSEEKPAATGYMNGFIDLVFEHGGKYYIADYKSDHIGTRPQDYAPEALARVMETRGYRLQYHIYTVALTRYLRTALGKSFDYNKHIGGSYYLFLRGIKGELENPNQGIYFDLPNHEVIEELDGYFLMS